MIPQPQIASSRTTPRLLGALLGLVLTPFGLWLLAIGGTQLNRLVGRFRFEPGGITLAILLLLLGCAILTAVCLLARLSSLAPAVAAVWTLPLIVTMVAPGSYFGIRKLLQPLHLYNFDFDPMLNGVAGSIGLILLLLAGAAALLRRRDFGSSLAPLAAILSTVLVTAGLLLCSIGSNQMRIELLERYNLNSFSALSLLTVLGGILLLALGFLTALRSTAGLMFGGGIILLIGLWYLTSLIGGRFIPLPRLGRNVDSALLTQSATGIIFASSLMLIGGGVALWMIRNAFRRRASLSNQPPNPQPAYPQSQFTQPPYPQQFPPNTGH